MIRRWLRVENIGDSYFKAIEEEYKTEGVNINTVTTGKSYEYSRSDVDAEFIFTSSNVEYLLTAGGEADATSAGAPSVSPKTCTDDRLAWLKGKFIITFLRFPNHSTSTAIGVSQPKSSKM